MIDSELATSSCEHLENLSAVLRELHMYTLDADTEKNINILFHCPECDIGWVVAIGKPNSPDRVVN